MAKDRDFPHRRIASAYLPQRRYSWYALSKLAADPVYAAAVATLRETSAPLLDLGCGIGLLAQMLRAQGFVAAYRGIDNDAKKIAAARAASARAQLRDTQFDCLDLVANSLPSHRGSVALLDMLQYLPPHAGRALIEHAAACITPSARLIIRTGLDRSGAGSQFNHAADWFARGIGWANAAPRWYPARDALTVLLGECGLRATFAPLTGVLPFDNWLIVAERVG